jgi:hypothetical protein
VGPFFLAVFISIIAAKPGVNVEQFMNFLVTLNITRKISGGMLSRAMLLAE